VEKFVERTVIYGVSGLVHEIGKLKPDEWFHLFVQEDWETPAREAIPDLPPEKLLKFLEKNSLWISTDEATPSLCLTLLEIDGSWQEFCAANDLEPHRTEIYEHWIVSDWLADKLEARGEVIESDFYGLTIWGRACTGQAILLDDVICSIYDELHPEQEANRIAELNDRFRSRCGMPLFWEHIPGGDFVFTRGIEALPPETQISIWAAVRDFTDFSEGNDPHAERDFGAFTIDDVPEKIFWKIDYFKDASCSGGAEDPSDAARCFRILTVMLASEY